MLEDAVPNSVNYIIFQHKHVSCLKAEIGVCQIYIHHQSSSGTCSFFGRRHVNFCTTA